MRFRLEHDGDEVLLVTTLDRPGAAQLISELATFLSGPVASERPKPKPKPRPKGRGNKSGPTADVYVAGRVWAALVDADAGLGERLAVRLRPWGASGGVRAEFPGADADARRSLVEAVERLAEAPMTDRSLRGAVMAELRRLNG